MTRNKLIAAANQIAAILQESGAYIRVSFAGSLQIGSRETHEEMNFFEASLLQPVNEEGKGPENVQITEGKA